MELFRPVSERKVSGSWIAIPDVLNQILVEKLGLVLGPKSNWGLFWERLVCNSIARVRETKGRGRGTA